MIFRIKLLYLLMDRAYEGDETRALAVELGYTPVVPPKSNRNNPWDYDKQLYKQRNQVERLFRRIKRFRRIFTRYDKLDVVFLAFAYFALIVDALMRTRPSKKQQRFFSSFHAAVSLDFRGGSG